MWNRERLLTCTGCNGQGGAAREQARAALDARSCGVVHGDKPRSDAGLVSALDLNLLVLRDDVEIDARRWHSPPQLRGGAIGEIRDGVVATKGDLGEALVVG